MQIYIYVAQHETIWASSQPEPFLHSLSLSKSTIIWCILTRVRPVCCTLIYGSFYPSSAPSASWIQYRSDSSCDLMSMLNWWLTLTMWSSSMLSLCLCPNVCGDGGGPVPPSCMPPLPLITCWCLCVCVCVCYALSPALSPGENQSAIR